jgi:hypothetical protein
MKNQGYKWGRFFCKLFKRAYRLEMTPEQKGRYISDVVKAYMMGIECGYENRRKEKTK